MKAMTFTEILKSEHLSLVESIEHGSSDPKTIDNWIKKLYTKTGYKWVK